MSIAVSCQIAPSAPFRSSNVEAVDPDQLTGPLRHRYGALALVFSAAHRALLARDQPEALRAVFNPWRQRTFHTPFRETTMAPHFSLASP